MTGKGSCKTRIILVMLFILSSVFSANAQRVLAITNAMTATREAARLHLVGIDMQTGEVVPAAGGLPGRTPLGVPVLAPDGGGVALSAGAPWAGGELDAWTETTWLSAFRTTPLEIAPGARHCAEPGWREWAACGISDPEGKAEWILILGISDSPISGVLRGKAEAIPWNADDLSFSAATVRWELPCAPVCAVPLPEIVAAAVLCHGPAASEPVLVALDLASGGWLGEAFVLESAEDDVDMRPAAMTLSRDSATLFVLLSGFSMNQGGTEAISRLHVLDPMTLKPRCAPVQLPGSANIGDTNALLPAGAGGCWAVTRVPGTDFAYLTDVDIAAGASSAPEAVKRTQHILSGVADRLLAASSPDGVDVAAAFGKRLEIWRSGERDAIQAAYDDPLYALAWTPEGLFLGEAGRLHLVDESTGCPLRTVQLRSGWVRSVLVMPPEWTLSAAHPWETPRLDLLPIITFHGQAAGRELRVLPIRAHHAERFSWRIAYNEEAMPWLRAHPMSGTGPDYAYLFVDPAHYDPTCRVEGFLDVLMELPRTIPTRLAVRSEVIVQVMPGRGLPRRILWIWADAGDQSFRDPADSRRLRALGDLLAAPPHYFAHREVVSPFQEPLDPYAIVVIDAAAAAQGAITRQAVLDYVAQGGALLFLGAHLEDNTHRELAQWLRPIGIRINTGMRVDGHYAVAGDPQMTRHWKDFRVTGGCAIYAEKGFALEPGGVEGIGAVFLARNYGMGRIALIAAPTPLESAALEREDERRFASELFRWLGRAALEIEDMDGDGLPDSLEDINNNGIADPGETDYRNPDTDSDGIPDGMEDGNRNGRVDDGETDPRNPDSDGDGIWDGADGTPAPAIGTPFLISATPSVPAEGGHLITITGGNLTPDSVFLFGEKRVPAFQVADGVTAWVIAPDFGGNDGGEVPLRVQTAGGALHGQLPGGYRYAPRSRIHLSLEATHLPDFQDPADLAVAALRFETPAYLSLDGVIAILRAVGEADIIFEDVEPGQGALAAHRRVAHRILPDGSLFVTLESGRRIREEKGEWARISWRPAPGAPRPLSLRIEFAAARAVTRQDAILNITTTPLVIVEGRVTTASPRRGPDRTESR